VAIALLMAAAADGDDLTVFLHSLGASDEQIDVARRELHLAGLATDLILSEGAELSAGDLADRTGVGVDVILGLWRTLGVAVPDEHRRMFSERDVQVTRLAIQLKPGGSHGDELLRVLGGSLARVAEAAVSLYVQTVVPKTDSPESDMVIWARGAAETTSNALRLFDSMGTIFAHHMRDAIDRQRAAQTEVPERSLFRLAVGFVDLVGFTPLSQHARPAELLELIGAFEARAFEVTAAHQGRIVKHIGDEVMFVALDAADACAIARSLAHAFTDGIEPRGGVAFGDVITRHGDYYGPVVNLASRLADLAIPREVLVDTATTSAAGERFSFRPAGLRLLKGFDVPVEVFSLGAPSA
jgi:adenylate cyclase